MILGEFEQRVFGPGELLLDRLLPYGFVCDANGIYHLDKDLSVAGFKASLVVKDGNLYGRVIEVDLDEEYGAFRLATPTGFAFEVGQAYTALLEDVAKHCYSVNRRLSNQANRVIAHIKDTYGVEPEYPWEDDDTSCIFREPSSHKWFGLIMLVKPDRLGRSGETPIPVMNVKTDPYDVDRLTGVPGIYLAYHMNKRHWITMVLNEEVNDDTVFSLIDRSHRFVMKPPKKKPIGGFIPDL